MATIAQKFQSQMQNELAEVVQALAVQYNFDVADALRFINSTEPQPFTRKVSLKKSKKPKVSDEEKEAAKDARKVFEAEETKTRLEAALQGKITTCQISAVQYVMDYDVWEHHAKSMYPEAPFRKGST